MTSATAPTSKPPPRRGLTPYQKEWTRLPRYNPTTGKARTKCFTKARRIGGSFASAVDSANLCAGYEFNGSLWVDAQPCDVLVVSATFAQAKEVLAEVGTFCDSVAPYDKRYEVETLAESIKFRATGKGVYALPCKAQSIRGYTGAFLWDEVAFAEQPELVWAALKIAAGPTLREPRGYPGSLVTTPWAESTLPHKLFTDPSLPFDRLTVDIYEAKRLGFPIDIEATRTEAALEEIFQVEYCCQWLHGGGSFFDAQLLAHACRSELPDEVRRLPSRWGIDIGRTHDLTAAVESKEHTGDVWITRCEAMRGVHFDDQVAKLSGLLDSCRLLKALVDQGLMGRPVLDSLQRKFGGRVEGANLGTSEQELFAVTLRRLLEQGRLRIYTGEQPGEMRALCTELSSIRATPTAGRKTTFQTPRNSAGHGDRAWGAMLSVYAPAPVHVTPMPARPSAYRFGTDRGF